ncbi:type I secretion C-terminal target domain-containing protein, partial [Mesorhizobium sp. B2-4-17]|uniref:type I secretion C-terminal target domain-containing protein n=1 Tax=Mesorhizobium sp. B2-4-17 TaxID=2589932 RepID=UPI00112D3EBB
AVVVHDQDGSAGNGSLTINIVDDQPYLGPIDHGVITDQAGLVLSGSLHLVAGADGISSLTITGTPPSNLTLDGTHHLIYQTVGNTLTAYADMDNSTTVTNGDTPVFTLTGNPNTGTYEFDLLQALTVMNSVNAASAFGSGPSQEQELHSGTTAVALLSSIDGGVNGSTVGWGAGNNNFDAGEHMRFDFTGSNSPQPVAGFNPSAPQYADFTFSNYKSGDSISCVMHFTDGTSATSSFDPSQYGNSAHQLQLGTSGKLIDYIDFTDVTGNGKVDLAGVASVSNVSQDLSFNVTATDHDGDTATSALTLHIDGGSTLLGTLGDDVLVGGSGNETMTGGAGADTFVINAATWTSHGSIHDLIADYHPGEGDTVDLSKVLDAVFGGSQTLADTSSSVSATNDGTNVHINVTHGGSNVEVATLTANAGISHTINIVYDDAHHATTVNVP